MEGSIVYIMDVSHMPCHCLFMVSVCLFMVTSVRQTQSSHLKQCDRIVCCVCTCACVYVCARVYMSVCVCTCI